MSSAIIQFNDLHYVYPDGHKAVNGVSFTIKKGETVGIIGANGAGKSTLLMLLMGLIFPTGGEVLVDGIKVNKGSLGTVRRKLGMVFQDPDDQLFMTTVYDDVAFGPRNHGLDEAEVGLKVSEALSATGIGHLRDRGSFKLSGGEKRMAAVASILAMHPDILVLDEPTNALDPQSRRRVITLLKELEQTKIVTSHDLDMILDMCDRTIVIKDGRVASDGPAFATLHNRELMESNGLELPLALQACPVVGKKEGCPWQHGALNGNKNSPL